MSTMLRIDASARYDGSHSRQVADAISEKWQGSDTGNVIVHRDIGDGSIPHINNTMIGSFFVDPADQTAAQRRSLDLSDQLIAELQGADILLLSLPFYNFSIPSALKAWIDHVVRVDQTFRIEQGAFVGTTRVAKAIVIAAYGASGYQAGGAMATADFAGPYLEFLMKFIGIEDVTLLRVDGTNDAAQIVQQHKHRAIDQGMRALNPGEQAA